MRLFFFFFFLSVTNVSYCQLKGNELNLKNQGKMDAGFQGVGFAFETLISNKVTTEFAVGFGGGYDIAEGNMGYLLIPSMYYSATTKYFYNMKKRSEAGKNIKFNSGNYIGLRLKYNSPVNPASVYIRNSILTNIHWGIQRSIGKKWIFNTIAGIGYAHDIENDFGGVYLAIDLKFSLIL